MLEESANRVSRKEDVERNMSGAVKKILARSAIVNEDRRVSADYNTNVHETEESLCRYLYYIATH